MSEPSTASAADEDLDVREIPKPQRHPLIFGRFNELAVGESFVLVNSHDPRHLHDEFERDHPGTYGWDYIPTGDRRLWRIRITKRAAAELPRVLADTVALTSADAENADAEGAVWRLEPAGRQLDANVVRLGPHGRIDSHLGPDQDVIWHILQGSGQIATDAETLEVRAGSLVWLPHHSRRELVAGADGLSYLSVHKRRPGLTITTL